MGAESRLDVVKIVGVELALRQGMLEGVEFAEDVYITAGQIAR